MRWGLKGLLFSWFCVCVCFFFVVKRPKTSFCKFMGFGFSPQNPFFIFLWVCYFSSFSCSFCFFSVSHYWFDLFSFQFFVFCFDHVFPSFVQYRGQKNRTRKKTNSWERRFPGTFRSNVPLILPIFSVFSVEGGPKVPRNFVPGNFFFLF